jgi:NADH dehydrogenase [ubiquinone] 1 alpha subcomplex assembly factor 6
VRDASTRMTTPALVRRGIIAVRTHARAFATASSSSSSSDAEDLRAAFRHCVALARARDYETYLCTLHLSRTHAPAAFAVRAFNVETASIAGATTESATALARLAWWRDVVDGLARGEASVEAKGHPVARALRAAIGVTPSAHARVLMRRIVDARIADARQSGGVEDAEALERYAADTHSSALALALDACGVKDTDCDHVASHLGRAIGITALLRGSSAHAKQRRCYLPREALARRGASVESTYRMESSDAIRDVAHEVASLAKSHLDSARAMMDRVPTPLRGFFLQATPTSRYLDALEARDFDVFDESVAKGGAPVILQARIAWNAYRCTY